MVKIIFAIIGAALTPVSFALNIRGISMIAGYTIPLLGMALGGFIVFATKMTWITINASRHAKQLEEKRPQIKAKYIKEVSWDDTGAI